MTSSLDSEKNIAAFYQLHPYLIARELGDKPSYAERVVGRNRLDLLFRLSNGSHSIVEFKRVPLRVEDLAQVKRYWLAWGKTHKMAAKHYLVGLRPKNEEEFEKTRQSIGLKIMIRIIPEDVPCFVRWCEKTRRYVRFEEGDKAGAIELYIKSRR